MLSEQEEISPQEARAKLRESFLKALNELKGKLDKIFKKEGKRLLF